MVSGMDKSTVYVVTDGSYSDYHICGIFDSKEKAEEAKRLFKSKNDVEEYLVNDIPDHPDGMWPFHVSMRRDGTIESMFGEGVDGEVSKNWTPCYDCETIQFHVWATDEQHAVKISNEQRIQILAANLWPNSFDEWLNSATYKARVEQLKSHEA